MVKRPRHNMWQQLIQLDKAAETGLQVQLRTILSRLIVEARIPADLPLPSSRDLATMLNVSRSTVTLAYQHLVDEGYLLSHERQGYFVNPDIVSGDTVSGNGTQTQTLGNSRADWDTRLKFNVAAQANIVKPNDWYTYPYPFIYGQVDAQLMPLNEWREAWRYAQGAANFPKGGYDLLDQDDSALVEQLRSRVLPKRGIWCQPENVLITLGTQNALALIAKLLIKPGSVVGIEDPGYPDARNLFALETEHIKLLRVDADGLVIDDQIDGCDYIYLTPSYQSPTTVTLSAERRTNLLAKAREHNIIIIEDDFESEAAFGDERIPSLKSDDADANVIYCGSLSKTLAPGLRLGFLVADERLIREARALRRLTIRHPPPLIESTVAQFIKVGYYDSHVNRLARAYRARWASMVQAIETHLPVTMSRAKFGGTSCWLEGPSDLDADKLAKTAAAEGILIEPGSVHFGCSPQPRNYFRLGFSAIAEADIEPGIKALAKLI